MNAPTLLQRITRMGSILMMGVSLGACSSDYSWKEEVQLSDGRVIVVERELLTESGGDEWTTNSSGSKPKEHRLWFEYPVGSSKKIEWRSTKNSPMKWPELPLFLDVEHSIPIVYSDVGNADGCHVYSKYTYRNNLWIEEQLPPQFEQRTTNLVIFHSLNKQSFFDLEAKHKNNSDVTLRTLMQIGPKHPYCR